MPWPDDLPEIDLPKIPRPVSERPQILVTPGPVKTDPAAPEEAISSQPLYDPSKFDAMVPSEKQTTAIPQQTETTRIDPQAFDKLVTEEKSSDPSVMQRILAPITDIPHEAISETIEQAKSAYHRFADQKVTPPRPDQSFGSYLVESIPETLSNIGQTGAGLFETATLPLAPIVGGAKSLLGHPEAEALHNLTVWLGPVVGRPPIPLQEAYEKSKEDVGTAIAAIRPKGVSLRLPSHPMQRSMELLTKADELETVANNPATSAEQRSQLLTQIDRLREDAIAAQPASFLSGRIVHTPAYENTFSFEKFYTRLKDDLNPINQLTKKLAAGEQLSIEQNPYLLFRLNRGSHGMARQALENSTFDFTTLSNNGKSLKEVIKPVKDNIKGLEEYAIARRSQELHGRDIETGLTIDEANQIVAAGRKKYESVFRDLVEYQKRVLNYLRDSGILSPEAYQAMLEANRDYVPLYRLLDPSQGPQGMGHGSKVWNPIHRIKGSDLPIISPLESIIRNTHLFIDLAERNRALTALADLADKSPAAKGFMVKQKKQVHPIRVSPEEIGNFLDQQGIPSQLYGDPEAFTIFRPNAFRPAPDEISVFRNGKREIYKVDPEVANAVQSMDTPTIGWAMRMAAAPARTLRAGAVLSPEFMARNPIRDQFTAFVFSKNGYLPVWDFVKGLGHIIGRSEEYQNWLKGGGANSAFVSLDRNYMAQEIRHLIQTGAFHKVKNVIAHPLEVLRIASEFGENATRVGEFLRARKPWKVIGEGKGIKQSAYEAREVTLDFGRIGSEGRALNMLLPFWNAQVEGVDRAARAFGSNPFSTSFKLLSSITIPSVLLWYANRDDPRVKEIPNWEKDYYWIIPTDNWQPIPEDQIDKVPTPFRRMIDGKWHVNNGTIYRAPKPFELGVAFGSVVERVLDNYFDQNPKAFKDLEKSISRAFLPNYIPQAFLPSIEQFANRSIFLERPLVPRPMEGIDPKYQFTDYTSETAKMIGNAISKISRETSFSSPIVVDNYIRQWTGGLGVYAVRAIDWSLRDQKIVPSKLEPEPTMADVPVLRAFVSRFPHAGAESIQEFYENYERRKAASRTIKYLAKNKMEEAALKEREQRVTGNLERSHKAMANQFKVVRDILRDKKMSPKEKRQIIDNTYLQMITIARAANQWFMETEKRPASPFSSGGRVVSYQEGGEAQEELPSQLPTLQQRGVTDKLLGLTGERFQTFPERFVREAFAPAQYTPGLRREDVTDQPPPGGWTIRAEPNDPMIEKALSAAGLVMSGTAFGAPRGAIGAGPARPVPPPTEPVVAKPLYSAVEQVVGAAKQETATPDQWLGYIRNQPGVKPEELEWMGFPEWIKQQKGQVTKEQVQDFVRGNQVKLKEVEKAASKASTNELAELESAVNETVQKGYISKESAIELLDGAWRGDGKSIGELEGLGISDSLIAPFRDRVSGGPTKFSQRQLPGGENYREMLLTLPEKKIDKPVVDSVSALGTGFEVKMSNGEILKYPKALSPDEARSYATDRYNTLGFSNDKINFRTSHWDEPNVLAHARINDRVIDGKKTLFLEEVQSDWHQKGRREGYGPSKEIQEILLEIRKLGITKDHSYISPKDITDVGGSGELANRWWKLVWDRKAGPNVPDAPFKTTWPDLILKRMIRYAAENGYERIAWTPGKVQADRYDLSKHVNKIDVGKNSEGYYYKAWKGDELGTTVGKAGLTDKNLSEHIGKDLAEKALKDLKNIESGGYKSYSGIDLRVGGEGMIGFYDKILPAAGNKLVKKYGAKVEQSNFPITKLNALHVGEGDFPYRVVRQDGTWVNSFRDRYHADAMTRGHSDWRVEVDEQLLKSRTGKQQVHSLTITPALRDAAMSKGFPMFAKGGRTKSSKPKPFNPIQIHGKEQERFDKAARLSRH